MAALPNEVWYTVFCRARPSALSAADTACRRWHGIMGATPLPSRLAYAHSPRSQRLVGDCLVCLDAYGAYVTDENATRGFLGYKRHPPVDAPAMRAVLEALKGAAAPIEAAGADLYPLYVLKKCHELVAGAAIHLRQVSGAKLNRSSRDAWSTVCAVLGLANHPDGPQRNIFFQGPFSRDPHGHRILSALIVAVPRNSESWMRRVAIDALHERLHLGRVSPRPDLTERSLRLSTLLAGVDIPCAMAPLPAETALRVPSLP